MYIVHCILYNVYCIIYASVATKTSDTRSYFNCRVILYTFCSKMSRRSHSFFSELVNATKNGFPWWSTILYLEDWAI